MDQLVTLVVSLLVTLILSCTGFVEGEFLNENTFKEPTTHSVGEYSEHVPTDTPTKY